MKVSVIMGIYNSERTLKDSLDSLVHQTFQDFELILCDDGSRDNTLEIAKSYKPLLEKRLIILKNTVNKGLAYSLNKCLLEAKGEYIARMDADDISRTNRFEIQMNYLEKHPDVDMVGCDALIFNDDGVWGKFQKSPYPNKRDFLRNSPFVHPTIIMKKTVLVRLQGYTVEKITRRTEDYDLFMRFFAAGYKGVNLIEPLLFYREDNEAYKRRPYRYRIDEMRIRYRGFKRLGLLPLALPFVIRPLIVGLIPHRILRIFRQKKPGVFLDDNSAELKT